MNLHETEEMRIGFKIITFFQHFVGFAIAMNLSTLLLAWLYWDKSEKHSMEIFLFIFSILSVVFFVAVYKRLVNGALKNLNISTKKELYTKMREYKKMK
jgi:hypothetical protein